MAQVYTEGEKSASLFLTEKGVRRLWNNVADKFEPKAEGKQLSSNDFTNENKSSLLAMQDRINIATKDSYKVKGNIIFSNLPASDNNVGDVYNITDAFTADETFIPSEVGNEYPPNINVVYTSEGWDILGGVYDFSEFMYKEDIKPISDDDITESLVLPEPVAIIKVGDLTFEGVQDNITFDAVFDEPQMITIDEPEYGRDLHYAITDTPVTSTFSGMRKARAASPFDSLSWIKYTGPFSLQYGNNIIYTRVISLDGQPIYNSSNGVHIHKYTDLGITSPATCLTNAVKTHKCDHCDDSYTEVLENTALGHDYVRTIQRPASCLENEIDTIACSRCDSSYTEEIQNTALGHAYNSGVITTPATCTQTGVKTFTCSRCNETKTESVAIDPNNHNYINEDNIITPATCTTSGTKYTKRCTRCNNKIDSASIPAFGHTIQFTSCPSNSFSNDPGYTACPNCGTPIYNVYITKALIDELGLYNSATKEIVINDNIFQKNGHLNVFCGFKASNTSGEHFDGNYGGFAIKKFTYKYTGKNKVNFISGRGNLNAAQ